MARRLTLLALLACAAARRPPQQSSDASDSESLDPFTLWEDYEDTYETPFPSQPSTPKPGAKVLLKSKVSELSANKKNKSELKENREDKNQIIKTTINIQSHTNFIVTKRPALIRPVTRLPLQTVVEVDEHQEVWIDDVHVQQNSTKKPVAALRTNNTRKQSLTTRRPQKTTRRRATDTTTTPPPTTTRKRQYAQKSTKPPWKKNPTCPPKSSWWLSTFFQDKKHHKSPKKQVKPGIFSKVYNWFMSPKSSWFGVNWFEEPEPKLSTTTTSTTPIPPSTSTNNWFQILLDSEDNDNADSTSNPNKKTPKKVGKRKTYKGYQLLRAYPDGQWKIRALLELQEDGEGSGLMWWTPPSLNGTTDILVPPDLLVDVKEHFKSYKIDFDVIIWDLQKAITYENPKLSKKQRLELEQLRGHPMTWRRYHRYADILRYLEYLQHSYSDVVELVPLGRSSEGLPLVAVKVSLPSNESQAVNFNKGQKKKWKLRSHMKPAVWLEAGAHAREWISPAAVSWMLHTLVEGPDLEMLNMADFYILPVLNPDGYEHSHTHDRLWKKTRSRTSDSSDDYYTGWLPWNWGQADCVGVDTDRNWDYHWGEKDSSRDPCAETYAGPHPFSEPETRAVSNFLSERKGQIKVYISLHAYSQAWLVPSSHTVAPFADDSVLLEMAKLATAALADLYGTKYQVGSAAEIRQPASGMSHDWAKARAGIKYSYHVDLRDSHGPYGFLLPGSQIVSTAKETWQAVKAIVDNLTPSL